MTILVWAEHSAGQLRKSALHAITAASALGPVTLLLVGDGARQAAEQATRTQGVGSILCLNESLAQPLIAEQLADLLAHAVHRTEATHLFSAATPLAKGVLPRLAALLGVMQLSEIVRIDAPDTFARPLYAGSALGTFRSRDSVKVVSVRISAFAAANLKDGQTSPIVSMEAAVALTATRLVSQDVKSTSDVDLSGARIVVSGGRGMGSAKQYALLEPLANKMGAALGASRAAVDAGYAPPERQVGQTGRIVAPDLYLAFGISGAVQHLAGMKDSKTIVAVNKDPEAPIFQVADIGLVADLFDVLPVLESRL